MNFLNALVPLRLYRKAKRACGMTCLRSWSWRDEAALDAETFAAIRKDPEKDGIITWQTHSKKVYKISGAAYKTSKPRPPARYIFLLSPSAREVINFRIFRELGIPLVQLLAGGEDRKLFRPPRNCWVMTRFAEDYLSGWELIPGCAKEENKALPENKELRKEFLRINLPLIARLHNAGCYHRGFRPYNIMFKVMNGGKMDCLWLDLASCVFYPLPDFMLRSKFLTDLKKFFAAYLATPEEVSFGAEIYLAHCKRLHISREELTRILTGALK